MPDRVLRAMHRAAPNIYEGDLIHLGESVYRDLNLIARNSGEAIVYVGNGHAAWEASLCNVLSRGDRILALVTGKFGHGWVAMARALGVEVQVLDFGNTQSADPAQLQAALSADTRNRIKAVITVQTDTATSISNDIARIRQAMNSVAHPALLMVDCIASFACEPFDMESWGVDVMLTASQKGLMTPPGLAIVFIRDTIWPLHEVANLNTPYWNWEPRVRPAYFAARFCGTPPTHHLYGLREALDMLLEEGIENVWQRHRVQAQAVWAAVDSWGNNGSMALNVPVVANRSLAVTSINTVPGLALRLRQWCENNAGLTLGTGLSPTPSDTPRDDIFRIGHMGHLNAHALLGSLACIEAGLHSLGFSSTVSGTQAAGRIMAEAVAD
ncbi:MAG: alanine--glyoxylate aminotransferase family protein [Granulosicoccus sp.]|nr:alanine--glyoxylate aminotransferase family protein [Granulosicoccus sp.]